MLPQTVTQFVIMAAVLYRSRLGSIKMVLLGTNLKLKPVVALELVCKALQQALPEKYLHTLPLNYEALQRGAALEEKADYWLFINMRV